MDFKFYEDSLRFIGFLFLVAICGMAYGVTVLYQSGVAIEELIIRALDIVTIVVPPALPAAMTVGTVYAQSRLKKKSIFCISPPRIPIGGKLKLICFDKTGTLTEDGLDVYSVVEMDSLNEIRHFKQPLENLSDLGDSHFLRGLASCHSLSIYNGQLTGDPLDIKMFESTQWQFIDEHLTSETSKFEQMTPIVKQHDLEIAIVKQFTFSSAFLRMSVLCKSLDSNNFDVYTKGAPEKIVELCKAESVPENFEQLLKSYTSNGYRVIALAGKSLDASLTWLEACRLSRDSCESDLNFYGFLIMQNAIKPETTPIINELHNADLRTVMVTGDNLLTALCVAKKCNMVEKSSKCILVEAHPEQENQHNTNTDMISVPPRIEWKLIENNSLGRIQENDFESYQSSTNIDVLNSIMDERKTDTGIDIDVSHSNYSFAMTGKSFGILRRSFPKIFEKILLNGSVYARMSPDQKAQLVEHLISIGYCVSMCGDGANDCSALKAAHVGISLSEAEASVASPFTSKIQNISCVPQVIKEGRCALVTSFGVFKYMALYSMIQFVSVLILYTFTTNLADPQFLYVDLFLITPVAIFMSANKANDFIAKKRPIGSLVGFVNVCSIIFQIILVVIFQVGTFLYLKQQTWLVAKG
jgi:cation-transporting ATPase 13A3/4/5